MTTADRAIAPLQAPTTVQRLTAELIGTFILVFGVIGTALYASDVVGWLGVSLAVGLAVYAGVSAFGRVSGGHFNPAVTIGLAAAGRFSWRETPAYLLVQVIGGLLASTLLYLIGLAGPSGWLEAAQDGGFASNGFGDFSPAGFGIGAAIAIEVILTAVFVIVILGVTHPQRRTKPVPLVIGLTLTMIHLVAIPIDNASINPARSIATAVFGGGDVLAQLWVFIVFPILGGLIGGLLYRAVFERRA